MASALALAAVLHVISMFQLPFIEELPEALAFHVLARNASSSKCGCNRGNMGRLLGALLCITGAKSNTMTSRPSIAIITDSL
jgi:hypothetical protein